MINVLIIDDDAMVAELNRRYVAQIPGFQCCGTASTLEKAKEIATARNLDINKQEILLLMRMNKQVKAADKLKEYRDLLMQYQQQNALGSEESGWIGEEMNWTEKMLSKISLL